MSQPNLSTPSFESDQPASFAATATRPQAEPSMMRPQEPSSSSLSWRQAWKIGGWTLAALVTIDVAVNQLFAYPTDHPSQPSSLETYFNYGRSSAGKLAQMVGPTQESSHILAQVGWLSNDPLASLVTLPSPSADPHAPSVTFYGMSFTQEIGEAMAEIAPELTQRHIAAPAAGPSYTFAAYEADADDHQSEVVILGVMADSIKALKSLTAASWMLDSPSAYSYPRYQLEGEELVKTEPIVNSFDQLRDAMADTEQWQRYRNQLAAHDAFYHPAIFEQSWLDQSAIARLIRRGLAQQHLNRIEAEIYDSQHGFIDPETNALLGAIVEQFASQARERGQFPIVLLIDNQDYNEHLFELLQPVLAQNEINYLSTHQITPANNPQNYIADGHFTADANRELALALANLIQQRSQAIAPPMPSLVESPSSQTGIARPN